ncbi:DEAD/DEAH box helicase family protein [Streptomyces sp. NPDC056061]|uniref:DEAD/DEAH box helicase family protein n=1 Tax=Streptomyces sp. NPDC056061 TaxID=3345700 RepID=UPI0035DD2718
MTDNHARREPEVYVMPTRSEPATSTDRRRLRADQQHAVDTAAQHLKSPRTRGHIVSACGTGKTLTALRIAEALDAPHLLVAVPSLDLIAQWATAARSDGRTEPLMAVSSLKSNTVQLLTRMVT